MYAVAVKDAGVKRHHNKNSAFLNIFLSGSFLLGAFVVAGQFPQLDSFIIFHAEMIYHEHEYVFGRPLKPTFNFL